MSQGNNLRPDPVRSSAGSYGTLYTSKGTETISGIVCANDGSDTYVRVNIVKYGESAGTSNVIIPGLAIKATETKILCGGITLLSGDTVQVKSTSGNVVFHLFGDIP